MARILTSNRFNPVVSSAGALCWALASACAARAGFETTTTLPEEPRRPSGVVLDMPPAAPSAADRVSAARVVALRRPLADKEVEELVFAYVRGFEREDLDALVELLAQDAAPIGRGGGKEKLVDAWRTRMKSFEYGKIAGAELVRPSEIQIHTYDSLGAAGASARPSEMRPTDLYVRVPIASPRPLGEPLFGEALVLLLRREDGRLRIAGQLDERLP